MRLNGCNQPTSAWPSQPGPNSPRPLVPNSPFWGPGARPPPAHTTAASRQSYWPLKDNLHTWLQQRLVPFPPPPTLPPPNVPPHNFLPSSPVPSQHSRSSATPPPPPPPTHKKPRLNAIYGIPITNIFLRVQTAPPLTPPSPVPRLPNTLPPSSKPTPSYNSPPQMNITQRPPATQPPAPSYHSFSKTPFSKTPEFATRRRKALLLRGQTHKPSDISITVEDCTTKGSADKCPNDFSPQAHTQSSELSQQASAVSLGQRLHPPSPTAPPHTKRAVLRETAAKPQLKQVSFLRERPMPAAIYNNRCPFKSLTVPPVPATATQRLAAPAATVPPPVVANVEFDTLQSVDVPLTPRPCISPPPFSRWTAPELCSSTASPSGTCGRLPHTSRSSLNLVSTPSSARSLSPLEVFYDSGRTCHSLLLNTHDLLAEERVRWEVFTENMGSPWLRLQFREILGRRLNARGVAKICGHVRSTVAFERLHRLVLERDQQLLMYFGSFLDLRRCILPGVGGPPTRAGLSFQGCALRRPSALQVAIQHKLGVYTRHPAVSEHFARSALALLQGVLFLASRKDQLVLELFCAHRPDPYDAAFADAVIVENCKRFRREFAYCLMNWQQTSQASVTIRALNKPAGQMEVPERLQGVHTEGQRKVPLWAGLFHSLKLRGRQTLWALVDNEADTSDQAAGSFGLARGERLLRTRTLQVVRNRCRGRAIRQERGSTKIALSVLMGGQSLAAATLASSLLSTWNKAFGDVCESYGLCWGEENEANSDLQNDDLAPWRYWD